MDTTRDRLHAELHALEGVQQQVNTITASLAHMLTFRGDNLSMEDQHGLAMTAQTLIKVLGHMQAARGALKLVTERHSA